jgi:hypothetical protein
MYYAMPDNSTLPRQHNFVLKIKIEVDPQRPLSTREMIS